MGIRASSTSPRQQGGLGRTRFELELGSSGVRYLGLGGKQLR